MQPFLTPVPPQGTETLGRILLPIGIVLGVLRTAIVLVLVALHVLLEAALDALVSKHFFYAENVFLTRAGSGTDSV